MTDLRTVDPRRRDLFSLVLPAYNPGPAIEQTLVSLQDFVRSSSQSWEIVIVCDGCTDGTPDRLQPWQDRLPELRVLSYAPNHGKGYALRQGLVAARGANRIFTDIDLSYPFGDVQRVADALLAGGELVIASRRHAESRLDVPVGLVGSAFRRHLQSLLFSRLVRLCLPLHQTDTQAGLKGMSARVADAIIPQLGCDGFGLDCELLTACTRIGVPITEIPVCVRYDQSSSTVNPRAILRTIRELWTIRRAWPAWRALPSLAEPTPIQKAA